MANPLDGFNLAQQGINLASSLSGLGGGGASTLRYPIKRIDAASDYLEIKILKYIASGGNLGSSAGSLNIGNASSTISNSKQSPLAYIQLPIPQNISESQSISWGEDSIDPYSAFMYGQASNAINMSDPLKETPDLLKNALKTAESTFVGGNGQALLKSKFAAMAASGLGANVSEQSILARTTGQVINPNMELLFNGPSIRTFPFTFEFAPREPAESQAIKKIIWTLKKHMTTKKSGDGLFIGTPDIFQLTYKTGSKAHPFLNKFKPAALIGLDVNYTGSGTYATYNDATPVHITMSLTFKELNPIYSEDYTGSDSNVGY